MRRAPISPARDDARRVLVAALRSRTWRHASEHQHQPATPNRLRGDESASVSIGINGSRELASAGSGPIRDGEVRSGS